MTAIFNACCATPIGFIRINGTARFISEVSFCDVDTGTDTTLPDLAIHCMGQIAAYFEGKQFEFTLPLKQEGTDFQQRVWSELLHVPYGETASYSTIARKIATVKSVRAIGNANGKNSIALLIPCHRIIGESGKLVGYAGGLWRKKWLLQHEAKFAHGVQSLF